VEETKLLRQKAEVRMAALKVIREAKEEDRLWTIRSALPVELLAINPVIVRKDQRDRIHQRM
jgi:hypothetical protein